MRFFLIGTGGLRSPTVFSRLRISGFFSLAVTTLCLNACQGGSPQTSEEFAAMHHCCRQAGGH
jgi:hypothetical protein